MILAQVFFSHLIKFVWFFFSLCLRTASYFQFYLSDFWTPSQHQVRCSPLQRMLVTHKTLYPEKLRWLFHAHIHFRALCYPQPYTPGKTTALKLCSRLGNTQIKFQKNWQRFCRKKTTQIREIKVFTEKIQFKNSLPVWGYSFPSTSQVHKFFQSMHIEWSKQWLPYILPIIFLRGTCVHTLCPTWSISLTIPGRV